MTKETSGSEILAIDNSHRTFLRATWCASDCTKLLNNPIISDDLKIELEKQLQFCHKLLEEINGS